MNNAKAIEALKLKGDIQIDGKARRVTDFLDALGYAIEVLKRMEPVEPVPDTGESELSIRGELIAGLCPNCNRVLFQHTQQKPEEWGDNYCACCGRPIIWPEHTSLVAWEDWEA